MENALLFWVCVVRVTYHPNPYTFRKFRTCLEEVLRMDYTFTILQSSWEFTQPNKFVMWDFSSLPIIV